MLLWQHHVAPCGHHHSTGMLPRGAIDPPNQQVGSPLLLYPIPLPGLTSCPKADQACPSNFAGTSLHSVIVLAGAYPTDLSSRRPPATSLSMLDGVLVLLHLSLSSCLGLGCPLGHLPLLCTLLFPHPEFVCHCAQSIGFPDRPYCESCGLSINTPKPYSTQLLSFVAHIVDPINCVVEKRTELWA